MDKDLEQEIKDVLRETKMNTMLLASKMVRDATWPDKGGGQTLWPAQQKHFSRGVAYAQGQLAQMLLDIAEGRITADNIKELYATREQQA